MAGLVGRDAVCLSKTEGMTMPLDGKRTYYSVFRAKDSRFDGRFFVGVTSTGIYCRPICRAKLPKIENCTFHETAASAELAGFRPCLLCRPELAPGAAPVDATPSLARRAARMLEECHGDGQSVEELAGRLGCTSRHLRRAFVKEYSVSPVQYLQTRKLLLAKNLLTDTDLSVLRVAMAAGFGSLRRFNDLFKKRYRLAPAALRKQAAGGVGEENRGASVTLALGYRPPYQWEKMLEFLELRAIPGVEAVRNGEYLRTVRLAAGEGEELSGWVRIGNRPQNDALAVTVDSALLPVLPQVLGRVRHLFDLYCAPDVVYEVLESMNGIGPDLCVAGARVPGCFDSFEMAVRAILGQQITVKGARTLAARLVDEYGAPLRTGVDGLTRAFPSPREILALKGPIGDRLGPLGVTGVRARTIYELARALAEGDIDFDHSVDPAGEAEKLLRIRGVGIWTAHYIAMRAMGWTDAFLHTDYGVKKALAPRSEKEILRMAEAWRPWRAYATVNLWNSL